MLRLFTIFVLVILSATAIFARTTEPCRLKLAQAPVVRDLRLGMSVADAGSASGAALKPFEVESRISFIKSTNRYVRDYSEVLPGELPEYNRNMRPAKLGNFRVDLNWNILKESLRPNASNIQLDFFQDKLDSISVTYYFKYAIWDGRDEFVRDLSAVNKLPLGAWTRDLKNRNSSLSCAGFDIKVSDPWLSGGKNFTVVVADRSAQKALESLTKQRWLEIKTAEEKFKEDFTL